MKKKHYNIPIFVPEAACPNRCVFCNQYNISGVAKLPTNEEVLNIIEEHLSTINSEESELEIAFFGGNFTGIDIEAQKTLLDLVQPYIKSGKATTIRLSTRPDYIDNEKLDFLKEKNVTTIELGAQSMDEKVLVASGRGHTVKDVAKAAKLIKSKGFRLGLQMMVGLPEDTLDKTIKTAKKIAELKADDARIYPTLVIKNTELENLYNLDLYKPLTIEQAVEWTKEAFLILEKKKINVIKVGLHPTEELKNNETLISGPYHPSFRELVYTEIWREIFEDKIVVKEDSIAQIYVPVKELNYAIGYNSKNKKELEKYFQRVNIKGDHKLHGRHCYVDYY